MHAFNHTQFLSIFFSCLSLPCPSSPGRLNGEARAAFLEDMVTAGQVRRKQGERREA